MPNLLLVIKIHNFVLGKMEEKGKGMGWGGGWVKGARAGGALSHTPALKGAWLIKLTSTMS